MLGLLENKVSDWSLKSYQVINLLTLLVSDVLIHDRHPSPASITLTRFQWTYPFYQLLCFQCNILFSARQYKLQLFTGFRRRVVVIFPSADEWKRRLSQHQMNNREQIPETALLKLQCMTPAYFIGNVTSKWFNDVSVIVVQHSHVSDVSWWLDPVQVAGLHINYVMSLLFFQWAAVFPSSRVTCWRSCSMQSCLRNRRRCSCRSIRTRLADCSPPSPNKRRRNPDFTRKDPTLTALPPHTGSSGVGQMVSMK